MLYCVLCFISDRQVSVMKKSIWPMEICRCRQALSMSSWSWHRTATSEALSTQSTYGSTQVNMNVGTHSVKPLILQRGTHVVDAHQQKITSWLVEAVSRGWLDVHQTYTDTQHWRPVEISQKIFIFIFNYFGGQIVSTMYVLQTFFFIMCPNTYIHLLCEVGVVLAPFWRNNSVRWIRTPNNPGWEMSAHKCCIDPKNFGAVGQAP